MGRQKRQHKERKTYELPDAVSGPHDHNDRRAEHLERRGNETYKFMDRK